MPSERQRILELALESLHNKKKQIDDEIAELTRESRRGGTSSTLSAGGAAPVARKAIRRRKRSRFSKEERERRSARMKAYWDKWRKAKGRK